MRSVGASHTAAVDHRRRGARQARIAALHVAERVACSSHTTPDGLVDSCGRSDRALIDSCIQPIGAGLADRFAVRTQQHLNMAVDARLRSVGCTISSRTRTAKTSVPKRLRTDLFQRAGRYG
jgi:hypothetical protein